MTRWAAALIEHWPTVVAGVLAGLAAQWLASVIK